MDKVKRAIQAGVSPSTAIKDALGMPVTAFAAKHGQPRGTTAEVINGMRAPTAGVLAALIAELGGTEAEWRALLYQAARRAWAAAPADKAVA
jgi:plasmid maintenance system antidote protein VapI